jgi:hypothetical protein
MNLTELSKTIRFDNASKGFDPTEGGVDRYLLLAISEICEAQNELRDGRDIWYIYYQPQHAPGEVDMNLPAKPCGFPVEIADAIIRLLDIAGKFQIEVNLGNVTAYKFDEAIDFYLLRAAGFITECHFGVLANFLTSTRFSSNLNSAIALLVYLMLNKQVDIFKVIDEKLEFNKSRPPKHGRKF